MMVVQALSYSPFLDLLSLVEESQVKYGFSRGCDWGVNAPGLAATPLVSRILQPRVQRPPLSRHVDDARFKTSPPLLFHVVIRSDSIILFLSLFLASFYSLLLVCKIQIP